VAFVDDRGREVAPSEVETVGRAPAPARRVGS
jgi:hypothetical protein